MKTPSALPAFVAALVAASVLTAVPSHAQFKLPDLGGGNTASVDAALADLKQSSHKTLADVGAARLAFMDAQIDLMQALGLKEGAATKLAESRAAVEGSSSDPGKYVKAMKESSKVSAEANKAMKESMSESRELKGESAELFARGTVRYIEGIQLEQAQITVIKSLANTSADLVQNAPPLRKPAVLGIARPLADMATLVPGDVKMGLEILPLLLKFADNSGVEIPNRDKAEGMLGDF